MRTSTPEQLWEKYHSTRGKDERNALVMHYHYLLHRIAKKMSSSMPTSLEELESDGFFGLIDAIEKFDESKGVRFEVYAVTRIRGSIIDGVRSRDHVPRSVRFKESKIQYAIEHLSQKLGYEPTLEEISDFTHLEANEISDTYRICTPTTYLAVSAFSSDTDPGFQQLVDKTVDGPGESAEIDNLRELIASSFEDLKEREKILLSLYYNEGLSLSEIGVVFGITEARASQIHIKTIRELHNKVLP